MEAPNIKKNEEEENRPIRLAVKSSPQSPLILSPTHDFEFTVSLPLHNHKTPTPQPDPGIDLCPADHLFFQGHLLPLHDSHLHDHNHQGNSTTDAQGKSSAEKKPEISSDKNSSTRSKPRSFSFFTLKKGSKLGLKSAKEVIDKCMTMLKPFFTKGNSKSQEQKSSSSGRQRSNGRHAVSRSFTKRRRSRSSVPCSSAMTSPGNSGILCAAPPILKNQSTMEELQNAIQAAIAHCKNSNAAVHEEDRQP